MLSIGANLSNLAYTQCSGSIDLEWRRKGWLCDCVWSSDTHVYLGLKLNATAKYNHGTEFVDEFNTVLFAIGRDTCTAKIWLEGVGVAPNPKNRKLLHNELERSSVDNIYAIGDVLVTTSCVYVCTTVREDN